MVNDIKLMLCNFEKKLAESKKETQDIEILIINMEMFIRDISKKTKKS